MSINVGRQVNLSGFHCDGSIGPRNARTPLPAALVTRKAEETWGGRTLNSEKEEATEAASAYVIDIPSPDASLLLVFSSFDNTLAALNAA